MVKTKIRIVLIEIVVLFGFLAAETPAVFSWQDTYAKVLPSGNLEWAPKPFVFEKGDSVRYIDFESGNDVRDGKTKQSAWKHHPWDMYAEGQAKACKGIHTYVFKGGVIYRGALKANESGEPGNPIRLTFDPSWGKREAVFYGSTGFKGGWKRASAEELPGMPKTGKAWYIDLGTSYDHDSAFAKFSAMWQVSKDKVERLHIAREPNYDLSDPNNPVKNWPVWSSYNKNTGTFKSPALKYLGGLNLLDGAVLWTERDFLMAAATKIRAPFTYDPAAGSLSAKLFVNAWGFDNISRTKVHFMIENVKKFLDAPGEYYFNQNKPNAGRLYLYPAGEVDPNSVSYEVAQVRYPIAIPGQHDIVISGLEFRYNDPDEYSNEWPVEPSPCVRITGNCSDITVKNCKFYYVAGAVAAYPTYLNIPGGSPGDIIDNIRVTDNDIRHSEMSDTILMFGDSQRAEGCIFTKLLNIEILRNNIYDTGFRHGTKSWTSIPAIDVRNAETCEIAGNIIDTSFGNGIITHGGKSGGSYNVVPLTRMLVHDNQMDNTVLGCNDYGGLEHFQGGPVYIYNNITRNCVGNRTPGRELGYSLYLDGAFKCYVFNNIIAGLVKPDQPDYYNNCGYFMVFGFMDQFFNNTIFHFENTIDGSSGNRSNVIGNLMLDAKGTFIRQNRPGDISMLGGGDTGEMGRIGIPTMAYADNVFYGSPKVFGEVAGISKTNAGQGSAPVVTGKTLEEIQKKLEEQKCRLSSVGWQLSEAPLVDPANKDYRPTPKSGAAGRGVKYFVPWALAKNVGEWNFFKSEFKPEVVLGEGFYMTDEYVDRGMYYFIPRNDLTVSTCTAKDYTAGPLEDWIEGALSFDGKRTASLAHAEMIKSMKYPAVGKKGKESSYDGTKRESMDMGNNNFLIEIYIKTTAGCTKGSLVSKQGKAGYELSIGPGGSPCLTLKAESNVVLALSTVKVNDGNWHHVIAEVDRGRGKVKFYVNGKVAGESRLDAIASAELSNTADFIVGKGFTGVIDFLRICRSTLAESKTFIEELYAWEFNGPFLRDFTGKAPEGKRDAGAMGR